ncbi:hypothetical protein CDD83_9333 [Cordyceps sp. RAO-2017]|nr:hypothetical protein CDD83_9333 [Cordyceps sp. RAO-2017]
MDSSATLPFFRVLVAAFEIYREPSSSGATISGAIVEAEFNPPIIKPAFPGNWTVAHEFLDLSQMAGVALIGYFETGHNFAHAIKGDYNIIGLSGGDSICIFSALLNDPLTWNQCPEYSFSRILGNTGHPGFSILTSPQNLMSRPTTPGAWRVVPSKFDGLPADHFNKTSLHLQFTDWRAPVVQIQTVGQRGSGINILEAVISVRDHGTWVADVQIHGKAPS